MPASSRIALGSLPEGFGGAQMKDGLGGGSGSVATRPERRPRGQDRSGAARGRPVFPLRDWHEGGKSAPSVPMCTLPYLPTPVSPFHAEPLHTSSPRDWSRRPRAVSG